MFTGSKYSLENDGDVALVINKVKVKPGIIMMIKNF